MLKSNPQGEGIWRRGLWGYGETDTHTLEENLAANLPTKIIGIKSL